MKAKLFRNNVTPLFYIVKNGRPLWITKKSLKYYSNTKTHVSSCNRPRINTKCMWRIDRRSREMDRIKNPVIKCRDRYTKGGELCVDTLTIFFNANIWTSFIILEKRILKYWIIRLWWFFYSKSIRVIVEYLFFKLFPWHCILINAKGFLKKNNANAKFRII